MAHNPVGICTAVTTSTSNVRSTVFSHQSDSLRVTALTKGTHIGIGTSGVTATPANYFVAENTTEVINIGKPRSQRVVGVTRCEFIGWKIMYLVPVSNIAFLNELGDFALTRTYRGHAADKKAKRS